MQSSRIAFLATVLALSTPALAFAQDDVVPFGIGAHFFVAVIAGVVLAIAFQLLLTNLALAAGISSVSVEPESYGGKEKKPTGGKKEFEPLRSARKLTSGIGVWTLLSSSLALFAATWLAVELSWTLDVLVGAVLGLVVWGVFYFAMAAFEVSAVTSLAGLMIATATAGLRSLYGATRSVLAPSPRRRATDTADAVVQAVRSEVMEGLDGGSFRRALVDFARELRPRTVEPDRVRDAILDALSGVEIHVEDEEAFGLEPREIVARLEKSSSSKWSTRDLQAASHGITEAFRIAKEEYRSPKTRTGAAADATLRLAGLSKLEAEDYRGRVEEFLARTAREELDPEGIKADLERLVREPQAGLEAIRHRLGQFDRETVKSVLAGMKGLSPERAERIVATVESAVERLRRQYQRVSRRGEVASEQLQARAEGVAEEVQARAEEARETVGRTAVKTRDQLADRLAHAVEVLDRPDDRYAYAEGNFRLLLEDPKAGVDSLLRRARSIDRDTIRDALASNTRLTHDEAEELIVRLETVRDESLARLTRMQEEVQRRLTQARDEAMHQAEEARKTAATAAWWAFATAVVSGGAAVAGGILAVIVG